MELLSKAVPVAMLGFVVSSMLAVGLSLTLSQIAAPLRNVRLVAMGLAANFVLMPLAAVALGRLLRLDPPLAVGLVILGSAAGAPFLPLLAQLVQGQHGLRRRPDGPAHDPDGGLHAARAAAACSRASPSMP